MQPDFLVEVLRRCRERRIHTAVDTSGFADPSALLRAGGRRGCDAVRSEDHRRGRHEAFTGVSNRIILENLRALAEWHPRVIIRFPLVPAVNDDEENVRAVGALAASLGLPRIDVLPYHRAGTAKYQRLNRVYLLDGIQPPSREQQDAVVRTLASYGLSVTSGGSS